MKVLAALAFCFGLVAPASAAVPFGKLLPDMPFPSARDYYEPLYADPTELGYGGRMVYPPGGPRYGEIMLGDYVGLVRWTLAEDWGAQANLGGGVIGRFNMSTQRNAMEVGDFTMALPLDVTYQGRHTFRTAFWHTSSHLGDDYIGRIRPPLLKRAMDLIKLMYSWKLDEHWRLYGGGSYAFNQINLGGRGGFQFGTEFLSKPFGVPAWQWFIAQDFQTYERVKWNPSYNLRTGMRVSDSKHIAAASIFMEYFSGRQYYLQFKDAHESHWGFGLKFEIGNPTR